MSKIIAENNVIPVGRPRRFTLKEAEALLPIVKRVTSEAVRHMEGMTESIPNSAELQAKVQSTIQRWTDKIRTLGCVPNGLWLVDFDNGEGFFCWQFGEDHVEHYHSYDAGFAGRMPIN